MARINLIVPVYIGKMGLPGKEVKLYNLGKRILAEKTLKTMGYRLNSGKKGGGKAPSNSEIQQFRNLGGNHGSEQYK